MKKEEYITFVNNNYNGSAKELILKQIDLFYDDKEEIPYHKYEIGEEVILNKGTYLHGISGELDNFTWIVNNGFIGNDFTNQSINNKIKSSIGMWNIQKDMSLQDYIKLYSGFNIIL